MSDLKLSIAKNIAALRKASGMTQFELAEKLNYSDKAVSKWERGESIPDISVLKSIADLFSVSVDYLLSEAWALPSQKKPKKTNVERMHICITLMSVIIVWFCAFTAVMILDIFPSIAPDYFITLLYSVPLSLIVWLIFNSIWFNKRINYIIISLLMWSSVASFFVSFYLFADIKFRFVFLLGILGQIIIYLWSRIYAKK